MKKLILFIALISGIFSSYADDETVSAKDYVLLINCQIETINWKDNYEDVISQYLKESSSIEFYAEHINPVALKRQGKYNETIAELFNKYKKRPQAICFVGVAAWTLFGDTLNAHFKDVPMLDLSPKKKYTTREKFLSTDNITPDMFLPYNEAETQKKYNITGVWSSLYIGRTLELMKQVLPRMNHIVFISDDRLGSYLITAQLKKEIAENFTGYSVDYYNTTTTSTNELLSEISKYGSETGIIFQNWYMEGKSSEEYYISNNLFKILGGFSKVPIFTLYDMDTQEGYTAGGVFNSMADLSNAALDQLKLILSGRNPREIPYKTVNKGTPYLNYANLSTYHLNEIEYPDGIVYYSKPESVIEKYKYQIIIIVLLLVFVITIIVIYALVQKRGNDIKKKQLAKEIEIKKATAMRNFKLSLSMQAASIEPWIIDLQKEMVYEDDLSKVLEHPDEVIPTKDCTLEELYSKIHSKDRAKIKQALTNLRSGVMNYLKVEYSILSETDNEKYIWKMLQASVYEYDSMGKPRTLIGISMEITDSKELEIKLRAAKDKAEEANKLKSSFLANMSHEIRTPLNAIVGFSGIIASTDNKAEKQELAGIINHNNLLLKLINDIMDISKIESGAAEFNYTDIDVNQMIDSVYSVFLKKSPVNVSLAITKCLPELYISAEKRRVTQVLTNLMLNAVKFTKQGRIEVGYYPPEKDKIKFYVKDTGCGIPQDQVKAIFGRFVKLNSFEQGSGLGLSLCELIVNKMNGEIGVISELGKGSEFWFTIPYVGASKPEEDIDAPKDDISTKNLKVLIAEDNESNYIVFQSMLSKEYTLIHAWNGKEAVELFKKYNPNIVIMDIKLPVLDGYEATAQIRKISQAVPIIAVSAYSISDDINSLMQNGFNEYEPKPLNRTTFKQKIYRLLGK